MTKRVLLDESVPRHLAAPLDAAGFSTKPYPNEWKQIKNGELLMLAEKNAFDVLITGDKNIYAQQNLRGPKLANRRVTCQPSQGYYGARIRHRGHRSKDHARTVRRH